MSTPLTGQGIGTGIGNPVVLSATPVPCTVFTLRAPASNSAAVFIGASTVSNTTGYQMDPGTDFTYDRNAQNTDAQRNLTVSDFYMCGAATDVVTWFASP